MIRHIRRWFHTVKHLRIKQAFYFAIRRGFSARKVSVAGEPKLFDPFQLAFPLAVSCVLRNDSGFRFLNVTKVLPQSNFDWCPDDVSRLWRYNLHYFDYLRDNDLGDGEKCWLLGSWVANNLQGSHPGWEPFTVSLRIVNWIFYLQRNPTAQTSVILHSLYMQTLWLEKNDERHILANHYFENLKALTFAGVFFNSKDARRWLNKGVNGLREQVREQTLEDGGHYERSPQYHGLMLENYLDIYNLVSNNSSVFDETFLALFGQHCLAGLNFYQSIIFPDNKVPLFNDTAFGISPELADLDSYWQRLSGRSEGLHNKPERIIALPDSGIFAYRSNADMFTIDAGDVGPDYQPGHTHCDMLSYELMLEGQRVIVDSGVSEYEPGEMRQYVRSTRAHNTISVDGAEQSEVWGEFRVARRAKVLESSIGQQNDKVVFRGAYCGFHELGGRTEHQREVKLELSSLLDISVMTVSDIVKGTGRHVVQSFIHLHPTAIVIQKEPGCIDVELSTGLRFKIDFAKDMNYLLEDSCYCPEFGIELRNTCVAFHQIAELPLELSYTIRKI